MSAAESPPPQTIPTRAPRRQHRSRIAWSAGLVGLAVIGSAAAFGWQLWQQTPDVGAIATRANAQPSRIVSSDGVLLDRIGVSQTQPVALGEVSPSIVQALLATEDRRFHDHGAIDLRRMVAAIGRTLQGDVQGASTLTQQLARNLFPKQIGNDRSILRKLREIMVAIKIERAYTKEQILTLYLNQVPYLYDVVGIEMAARTYFSKPASEIEPHEAALLVAMLKGPNYFDPERRPERARDRRNLVLSLMEREGYLDAAAYRSARERPLDVRLTRHDTAVPLAPHYLRSVRTQVAEWAEQHGLDPRRDGLTIQVGLDSRLQRLAEQAVERQGELLQSVAASEWSRAALRVGPPAPGSKVNAFEHFWRSNEGLRNEVGRQTAAYRKAREEGADDASALKTVAQDEEFVRLRAAKTRLEAGLVAIDPRSGQVRAWVGSRDWRQDRFDHVAQARRQPGSTFKPFVYGAALVAGIPQNQVYYDSPVTLTTADGQVWTPGDVGGSSGQPMLMRTGLARSRNTITAQVMQQVGPHQVARFARSMGIEQSPLDPVLSLALGTSPVTLLEMAGAYGTLAALGTRRDPLLIDRIEDRDGRLLVQFDSQPRRVLEAEHATLMVDILREAVDSGTGTALRTRFDLKGDIAGKTGTTQRNSDGWFLSLQPGLVVGAWVGFNDQRVTMRSNQWGQGGHSALLLVGDLLRQGAQDQLIDMEARFPTVPRPAPPMRWVPEPAEVDEVPWESVASTDEPSDEPMLPVRSARFRFDAPDRPMPVAAAAQPPAQRSVDETPAGGVRQAVQVIGAEPGAAARIPLPAPAPAPVAVVAPMERVAMPAALPTVAEVVRPAPEPAEAPPPAAPVEPLVRPQPAAAAIVSAVRPAGQPVGQPVGRPIGRPVGEPIGRSPSPPVPVFAPPAATVPPAGEPVGRPYIPGPLPIQVHASRIGGAERGDVLHIEAAPVDIIR